jgi:hypothetical protein
VQQGRSHDFVNFDVVPHQCPGARIHGCMTAAADDSQRPFERSRIMGKPRL